MFTLNVNNILNYTDLSVELDNVKLDYFANKLSTTEGNYSNYGISLHKNNILIDNTIEEDNPTQYQNLLGIKSNYEFQLDSLTATYPWLVDYSLRPDPATMVLDETVQLAFDEFTINKYKELRTKLVSEIVVTTSLGNAFDGNEDGQTRMSRAIAALPDDITTISWKLADNSFVDTTKPELLEALQLAGLKQTELWAF